VPAKAREGTIIIHMQSLLQRPASATEMGALRYTQMGALRIPRLPTPRATLPSRGADPRTSYLQPLGIPMLSGPANAV